MVLHWSWVDISGRAYYTYNMKTKPIEALRTHLNAALKLLDGIEAEARGLGAVRGRRPTTMAEYDRRTEAAVETITGYLGNGGGATRTELRRTACVAEGRNAADRAIVVMLAAGTLVQSARDGMFYLHTPTNLTPEP